MKAQEVAFEGIRGALNDGSDKISLSSIVREIRAFAPLTGVARGVGVVGVRHGFITSIEMVLWSEDVSRSVSKLPESKWPGAKAPCCYTEGALGHQR